jgi:hypothetical protein
VTVCDHHAGSLFVASGNCGARSSSAMELRADVRWSKPNVGEGPILLQKSKIERRRKSRESRFLDVSTAAGDSELNRCHLLRAKVGSRQLPGPYRSSERRWRKREAIAMPNDQNKIVSASAAEPLGAELERLLQPARYFRHPVTSSGTPPLLPLKSEPSCRHGLPTPVPSNRCLRYGRSQLPVASSNLMK